MKTVILPKENEDNGTIDLGAVDYNTHLIFVYNERNQPCGVVMFDESCEEWEYFDTSDKCARSDSNESLRELLEDILRYNSKYSFKVS